VKTYLEEEPDDKDLEGTHAHDQRGLNQTEVDDSLLCAPDRAKVPVFARAEIFLVPADGRQLARDLEKRLFES
jgi:hypothetical protein